MAYSRGMSVVMLLALASVTATVRAEETKASVEATIPRSGNVMGVGFDALWMMDLTTNKLVRINTNDNSATEIVIPGAGRQFYYSGIAVGEGAVWLPDDSRSIVYKIDPMTSRVAKEIPADLLGGGGPQVRSQDEIAVGEGAVWALTSNNELRRYSTHDDTQQATISLPTRSSGVAVAFGSVWVTGTGNDELYRIDPTTNQIAATIALRADPRSLAAGEGSIWVRNEGDGTLQRIDGKSGGLLATIETGGPGRGAIAVGGGFVWVSTHAEPVIQIDPRTNSVRGKFKVKMTLYSSLRFAGGSLWVSGESLRRIKPPE